MHCSYGWLPFLSQMAERGIIASLQLKSSDWYCGLTWWEMALFLNLLKPWLEKSFQVGQFWLLCLGKTFSPPVMAWTCISKAYFICVWTWSKCSLDWQSVIATRSSHCTMWPKYGYQATGNRAIQSASKGLRAANKLSRYEKKFSLFLHGSQLTSSNRPLLNCRSERKEDKKGREVCGTQTSHVVLCSLICYTGDAPVAVTQNQIWRGRVFSDL